MCVISSREDLVYKWARYVANIQYFYVLLAVHRDIFV